jgi:iron(III) transport system ATP-binding protein
MAELRCEHIAASYQDRRVLSDVDLSVPEGTLTAILGASGCGKTTLLRVIMGFTKAHSGRVIVGETVVADERMHLAPEKRGVGYVAQEGALYPHLNVAQNVAFGLARSERKDRTKVAEVLRLVGLSERYAHRLPGELSGGEQRRVSLARALAPRPRVVLLDEPFSGLDAALRVETRRAVLDALAHAGTTALLVTHDQAEAFSMGRQVAVLRDGRLVQTAYPSDLYRTPVDLEVARFVGDAVVLSGHFDQNAGLLSCSLGLLPVLGAGAQGPVQAMLRPEQLRLGPSAQVGGQPEAISAVVVGLTYMGAETLVQLSLQASGEIVLAKTYSQDAPRAGETVDVSVHGPVVVYPDNRHSASRPADTVLTGSTRATD